MSITRCKMLKTRYKHVIVLISQCMPPTAFEGVAIPYMEANAIFQ